MAAVIENLVPQPNNELEDLSKQLKRLPAQVNKLGRHIQEADARLDMLQAAAQTEQTANEIRKLKRSRSELTEFIKTCTELLADMDMALAVDHVQVRNMFVVKQCQQIQEADKFPRPFLAHSA